MKSAIALSMHKAGSSIADIIFTEVFKAKGYEIDRISKQVPGADVPEPEVYHRYQPQMRAQGVYYGIARHPGAQDMEVLPRLKMLIQMRDPRDCITSLFFSLKESHVLPTNPDRRREFEQNRQAIQQTRIDEYAVNVAPGYLDRCRVLERHLRDHPDVLLLKYEEMVGDTARWLDRIAGFTGQPMTNALMQAITPHANFSVARENPSEHKRQVAPGDHRRKLSPDAVARVTEILAPGLEAFGYDA